MTTTIFNIDKTGIELPLFVEKFSGTKQELIDRLKKLQLAYCENERPEILILKSGIVAESLADFIHIAKY